MIKLSTAILAIACLGGAAAAAAAQDTTAADKKAAGTQAGTQAGVPAGQTAPAPPAAQSDSGTGQDKPAARKKEQQDLTHALWKEQALQLLPSVTSEAEKIEDIRERLYIIGRAAGVLWSQDPERAQFDFLRVADAIDAYRPNSLKPEQLKPIRERLWGDLLQEAVRHDRALAASLQQVKAKKDKDFEPPDSVGEESKRAERQRRNQLVQANTLAQMAEEALGQKKVDQAVDLARQSLDTGVASQHLANILIPLKMSAGAQVDQLFETYLTLLLQKPDLPPMPLNLLAVYTFPDMQMGPGKNVSDPPTAVSPKTLQKFLDAALLCLNRSVTVLEAGAGQDMNQNTYGIIFSQTYAVATRLQPKFAAHAPPEKVEMLNALLERLAGKMSQRERRSMDSMIHPARDLAQIVEKAGKEDDPLVRDNYYSQAALMALNAGDPQRAQEILDKVGNPVLRQRIEQQLLFLLVHTYISQGNITEALAAAQRLKPQEQFGPLVIIARAMAAKGDQAGALELLDKVRRTTEQGDNDLDKIQRLSELARVYLLLAPESGFDLLKPITSSANEVLGPTGNRIIGSVQYPDRYLTVPNPQLLIPRIFNLDDVFGALARQDFFRAHEAARSLARPELRLHTQLTVLRSALEPDKTQPPKPDPKPAGTKAPPRASSN
jgi:hypothetical protein